MPTPQAESHEIPLKRQRLVARVTDEQKALIQRAADVQGKSLSDFVVSTLQDAAARTITNHETIMLGVKASEAFVEAMMRPAPLPARLEAALLRYRQTTGL